jgi:hypothetical protein
MTTNIVSKLSHFSNNFNNLFNNIAALLFHEPKKDLRIERLKDKWLESETTVFNLRESILKLEEIKNLLIESNTRLVRRNEQLAVALQAEKQKSSDRTKSFVNYDVIDKLTGEPLVVSDILETVE